MPFKLHPVVHMFGPLPADGLQKSAGTSNAARARPSAFGATRYLRLRQLL
jgi:hypothetical protein